jgi:hypothetical protein
MATMGYLQTETFKPLGDNAIMELAYKEWSAYSKKAGGTSEEPSTQLSDVFMSDLTGLRYAVISSFIGILAVFQVDGQNNLRRLTSWPPPDISLACPEPTSSRHN